MNSRILNLANMPLVLLVDDLSTNLHVLIAALKTDFRLRTATSGDSALALLKNQPELPKLIVLDVKMPGLSGIDVLRQIRADPNMCDIPVILVSADASEQNELDGLNIGADDYLVKPISPGTLNVRVHNLIRRNTERRELRLASFVFNYSGEAIIITDRHNLIIDVNMAFNKLTGYSKDDVLGKNPKLLSSGQTTREEYQMMWQSILAEGFWQGEMWDKRKDGRIYPKLMTISVVRDKLGDIEFYLANFVDVSRYKESERLVERLAHHDTLTGLPNRLHLQILLEKFIVSASRASEQLAVMFLDLDRFKHVNDTLGHAVGDELLIQVAIRLTSCLREQDMVARLGGDEFVVVLRDPDVTSAAAIVAEKITRQLSQPFYIDTYTLHTSTSIGIALYPDNAEKIQGLMKNADTAMYCAKAAGGGIFRFFSIEMDMYAHERLEMEIALHEALEKHQLQLYFQIQVDHTDRAIGAEVLLRWLHPERGLVSHMQFIPMAEESGLIVTIGYWVLDKACAQLKTWQGESATKDLMLAVNVSVKQFLQNDFVARVQKIVELHAINSSRLKLEITESLLLKNTENMIIRMNALKSLGIEFSIDNFGTGYSCFQYLKRLPVNQIKIDQSFVRDVATNASDAAIVRTIIAMAHNLQLEVIAEGVETPEQRQLLLDAGCKQFQGYLFGKPVPIAQLELILKSSDQGLLQMSSENY